MRIIAGKYRRRPLQAPKGWRTRPTTDRTREALFNLVEARMELDDTAVLDLFGGTGALGLEAISRGAAHATFVEIDARVLAAARQNAASLGVDEQCAFVKADVNRYLTRAPTMRFDLVLADPPYDDPSLHDLPDRALAHVRFGGLFVLEHDVGHSFEAHAMLDTARPYGRTVVSIFRRVAEDKA